jgi:hypothetical protein
MVVLNTASLTISLYMTCPDKYGLFKSLRVKITIDTIQ